MTEEDPSPSATNIILADEYHLNVSVRSVSKCPIGSVGPLVFVNSAQRLSGGIEINVHSFLFVQMRFIFVRPAITC